MLFQYNTDRIVLRLLDESCSKEVLDFYLKGDSYFGAMEPDRIEGFYTEDYQRRVLKYETECFMAEKCARYYIYEHGGREIIGTVALRNVVRGSFLSATIGYKLLPEYTGCGIATEAVNIVTDEALKDGLHRIVAYVQPENTASIKVLEHCGYELEGIARDYAMLKGRWHDHAVYSRIAGKYSE
ncbi:acetyltransferases including N-acetylases of ribosomal proteins [Firmicutes bacterium CAG:882]|nr:acetyltransferases including N-acetylases of ribosomal proteins [Firmicutes bacterium CAG:882]